MGSRSLLVDESRISLRACEFSLRYSARCSNFLNVTGCTWCSIPSVSM